MVKFFAAVESSMLKFIRDFFQGYVEFHRAMNTVKVVAGKTLTADDAWFLAAVASELGVGVQEARDGSWRNRFQVVDEG